MQPCSASLFVDAGRLAYTDACTAEAAFNGKSMHTGNLSKASNIDSPPPRLRILVAFC
jgi:hypothetical protein